MESKDIVTYYEKLNTVIEMQNELLEMKKELEGRGLALPLQVRQNKTADMKKYLKEYYEKNKEKYKQRASSGKGKVEKEMYTCEVCNCTIQIHSKQQHENTKKHKANKAKLEGNEEQ